MKKIENALVAEDWNLSFNFYVIYEPQFTIIASVFATALQKMCVCNVWRSKLSMWPWPWRHQSSRFAWHPSSWWIMHHHTKFGCKRFKYLKDIGQTNPRHTVLQKRWFQYPPPPPPQERGGEGGGGIKTKVFHSNRMYILIMAHSVWLLILWTYCAYTMCWEKERELCFGHSSILHYSAV